MAEKEYVERNDLIERFKSHTKSWERDYGTDAPAMVRVYQDFLYTVMGLRAADVVSREAYESVKRDTVRAFEEGQEFIRIADSYVQRNKELEIELDAMRGAANSLKIHYENARAEAIKELAERLKEKSGCIVARRDGVELYTTKLYQIRATDIDNLVAEMTEGK